MNEFKSNNVSPKQRSSEHTPDRIAVLLASFQGAAYIQAQLDSILAQTVPDLQIIISDDGSTDGTRQILEKYKKYYPDQIVLKHRVKKGEFADHDSRVPSAAMNFFWLMSQTDADYVLLSDQDDVWDSQKVEKLLKRMKEIETPRRPVLVYSDMEVVDADLWQISPSFFSYSHVSPRRTRFSQILVENPVTGGSLMMNRPLLRLARQLPWACYMHDWWIALCASCFGTISCVREPLSMYRQHNGNLLGARKTGSLEDLWQRIHRQRYVETGYWQMFLQARVFGKEHRDKMNPYQKVVLHAFLSLLKKNPIQRLRIIMAYRFFKTSWLQTVAQCVTIPRLK